MAGRPVVVFNAIPLVARLGARGGIRRGWLIPGWRRASPDYEVFAPLCYLQFGPSRFQLSVGHSMTDIGTGGDCIVVGDHQDR